MTTSKINNYFTKSPEKQPFKRKATTKSSTTVQSGQKIRPNGSTPPTKSPEKDTSSSPKVQDLPKDNSSNSSEDPTEFPKAQNQSTTAHRVRFLIRFGGFYGFILRFIPALFLFQKGLFTDDFTKMLD
jgi:hypothetical protein